MTYHTIQSEKERNSKVTADECRAIFNDFAEKHEPGWQLDERFEAQFDEILQISNMTSNEYYEYLEKMYQDSKAWDEEHLNTPLKTKTSRIIQKTKNADGTYTITYAEEENEENYMIISTEETNENK